MAGQKAERALRARYNTGDGSIGDEIVGLLVSGSLRKPVRCDAEHLLDLGLTHNEHLSQAKRTEHASTCLLIETDDKSSVQPEIGLQVAGRKIHQILDVPGLLETLLVTDVSIKGKACRINDCARPRQMILYVRHPRPTGLRHPGQMKDDQRRLRSWLVHHFRPQLWPEPSCLLHVLFVVRSECRIPEASFLSLRRVTQDDEGIDQRRKR